MTSQETKVLNAPEGCELTLLQGRVQQLENQVKQLLELSFSFGSESGLKQDTRLVHARASRRAEAGPYPTAYARSAESAANMGGNLSVEAGQVIAAIFVYGFNQVDGLWAIHPVSDARFIVSVAVLAKICGFYFGRKGQSRHTNPAICSLLRSLGATQISASDLDELGAVEIGQTCFAIYEVKNGHPLDLFLGLDLDVFCTHLHALRDHRPAAILSDSAAAASCANLMHRLKFSSHPFAQSGLRSNLAQGRAWPEGKVIAVRALTQKIATAIRVAAGATANDYTGDWRCGPCWKALT